MDNLKDVKNKIKWLADKYKTLSLARADLTPYDQIAKELQELLDSIDN